MAIADIGLQIRDSNVPQLLLEYDGVENTTFEVDVAGKLTITPTGGEIDLVGNLTFSGDLSVAGQIFGPDGSTAAPSYSFSSEPTSGMFLNAVGQVRIAALGVDVYAFDDVQNIPLLPIRSNLDGAASAPQYSFLTESGMGMFKAAAGVLGFATVGGTRLQINDQNQVLHGDGTNPLPSISFISAPTMGMYKFGPSSIGFAIGGIIVNDFSDVAAQFRKPIHGDVGTQASPQFSWYGDPASGMFLRNVGQDIGFSINALERFRVSNVDQYFWGGMRAVENGTNLLPAFMFHNAPSTGMYLNAVNLVFTVSGSVRQQLWATEGFTQITNPIGQEVLRLQSLEVANTPFITFYNSASARLGFIQAAGAAMLVATDDAAGSVQLRIAGAVHFQVTSTIATINGATEGTLNIVSLGAANHVRLTGHPTGTGAFIINTSINSILLATGGTTRLTIAGVITSAVQMQGPIGLVATPTYSFTSLSTTGMYAEGSQIRFATAGVARFAIGATQIFVGNGTPANPSYSFFNDSTAGMYFDGGALRFSYAGANMVFMTAGEVTPVSTGIIAFGRTDIRWSHGYFDNLTVTNPPWGGGVTYPLTAPDGAPSSPQYSWVSDTSSGFWFNAAQNEIGISIAGSTVHLINSFSMYPIASGQIDIGSAGLPYRAVYSVSMLGLQTLEVAGMTISAAGVGFFGAAAIAKPTIVGSRGANPALDSLLIELDALGLITNSTVI